MPHTPRVRVRRGWRRSLVLAAAVACTAAPAASAHDVSLVAGGLANPRGLDFGPGGHLYVAESGRGGSGPCFAGPEGESCVGLTGSIARIDLGSGEVARIIDGLPSHATQAGEAAGTNATGPNDVDFNRLRGYFTVGLGADPAVRGMLGPAGAGFAGLYRFNWRGRVRKVADLGAYETESDPDVGAGGLVDTNPFGVDASDRDNLVVTDAGGNDLLGVTRRGEISLLGLYPFDTTEAPPFLGLPPGTEIPYQPVPTGVTRGPDGAYYNGELTGFPFPVGAADVYRTGSGSEPAVYRDGFTHVIDVAFGSDGTLYVLQIFSDSLLAGPSPGKLIRVRPDGSRKELAPGQLTQPTGLAIDAEDNLYVSNQGGSPTDGQIVRISADR